MPGGIVIDLNSIDISEDNRSAHFVKLLVQLNIQRSFEILTLCFPRIMRYLYVTFRHGVNGHRLDQSIKHDKT